MGYPEDAEVVLTALAQRGVSWVSGAVRARVDAESRRVPSVVATRRVIQWLRPTPVPARLDAWKASLVQTCATCEQWRPNVVVDMTGALANRLAGRCPTVRTQTLEDEVCPSWEAWREAATAPGVAPLSGATGFVPDATRS